MAGADLGPLTAEVTRDVEVKSAAATLLEGLSAKIAELKNDPAALQALSDQLKASSDALAAAIVANTPSQ